MVKSRRRFAGTMVGALFLLLILLFGYSLPTSADSFTAGGALHHPELEPQPQKDAGIRYVEQWGNCTVGIGSAVETHRMHPLALWILLPLVCTLLSMSAIATLIIEPGKDPSRWVSVLFLPPVIGWSV
jgi:hypothetical protein